MAHVSRMPADRFRSEQRVDDRLLGRLGSRVEQRVQRVIRNARAGRRATGPAACRHIARREGDRNVAAPVTEARPGARDAGSGARCKPAQLPMVERRIGREDDDDRSAFGRSRFGCSACERSADWNTPHDQLRQPAEIRQHERSDHPLLPMGSSDP